MALQVWLPLTKDLRNQGLDNITITTANTNVFQNEGKISNKSIDVSGHYAFRVPSLVKKRVFSCSFWYKPITDSSLSDNWRRIVVFDTYTSDGSTTGAIFRFESSYGYQSTSTSYCISIHNNAGEPIASIGVGLGATDGWNKWQHIAITADGTTLKCYRNGVQVATGSMSNGGMLQGTVHIGYTGNRPIGRLNDFRLYDHCLSPMEVKELSKGLVLHYPLNRGGRGQENLLPCGGTYTQNSPWSTTLNRVDGWSWVTNSAFEATPGKTYTISVECDGTLANTHGASADPSVKSWTFWLYICNTDTTKAWQSGSYDTPVNLTSVNNNYRKIGNTHVWTYTLSSTQKYISLRTNSYSNGTDNVTVNWWNMKVEEGDTFTGWSPNSSSTLGQSMGLNSTTEYDCSGFCNNGTKVGTLGWSSNTSKYNVSLDVTSDSCARYIYGPAQTQLTDQITLACWLYQTSATATSGGSSTTNQFALSQGRDYLNLGFNITVNNGKPGVYAGNGGSESGARVSLISTTKTITGSWHHVAATYNNGALKLYVDGQLDRETTIGALDYVDAPALVVGKMAYGYTYTTSYFPFVGYISDARVYATALSADDVLSLYQNSAYIDSSGNVYGAVHSEV